MKKSFLLMALLCLVFTTGNSQTPKTNESENSASNTILDEQVEYSMRVTDYTTNKIQKHTQHSNTERLENKDCSLNLYLSMSEDVEAELKIEDWMTNISEWNSFMQNNNK